MFMKRSLNFLAAAILLITPGCAVIAQSQSEESPADANKTGGISGQVVSDTGQPLAKIEEAMERDRFLAPDEAKIFGLIDEIAVHRAPSEAKADESKTAR